jgi:hypothetical protein
VRKATFLLAAGLMGCGTPTVDVPVGDPYEIPWGMLSTKQAEKVHKVLDEPTAIVNLERTEVRSRLDVYEFLLDELPFTAGVLRELKESKYLISRPVIDAQATDEERKAWRRTYLFDDQDGLRLQAEMVFRDARRSIYYTYGRYDLGLVQVWGRSVIVVVYQDESGALMTEARVYTQVEGKSVAAAARILAGALENAVKRKGFAFIKVAQKVAELTASNARVLYDQVKGSTELDAAVTEEYRRRFVR